MHDCHSPDSKTSSLDHFGWVDPQKRKYQCEGSGLCPACLYPVLQVSANVSKSKLIFHRWSKSEENGLLGARYVSPQQQYLQHLNQRNGEQTASTWFLPHPKSDPLICPLLFSKMDAEAPQLRQAEAENEANAQR